MSKYLLIFVLIAFGNTQSTGGSIEFNPDQLGQSTFFISNSNPYIFDDLEYRTLRFEGNFRLPTGSTLIPDVLSHFEMDTSLTTYFNWNQGDYQFRQIQLGIQTHIQENKSIELAGLSRSFPGRYSHLGPEGTSTDNVLQNYLLSVRRADEHHELEFDWFYHKENTGLPIADFTYFNRQVESFLIGGAYKYVSDNIKSEVTSSVQVSKVLNQGWISFWDIQNTMSKWFTNTTQYSLNKNLDYHFKVNYKSLEFQNPTGDTQKLTYSTVYNGVKWKISEPSILTAGIKYSNNSKISLECGYQFAFGIFLFDLHRQYLNTFYHSSDLLVKTSEWFDNSATIRLQTAVFQTEIASHQITFEGEDVWIINPKIDLTLPWLSISLQSSINSADSSLFTNYSQYKVKLIPYLKNKPFRPFIAVDGIYMKSTGFKVLDLLTPDQFTTINYDEFEHSTLNASVGLLFEKFEISFNWIQFIVPVSAASPYIMPIEPLNYLRITWLFTD